METISIDLRGQRVQEERKRLGLTQAKSAELCGVKRLQWIRYEKNEQKLDGDVLRAFAAIGADASYILGGIRANERERIALDAMLAINAKQSPELKKEMDRMVFEAAENMPKDRSDRPLTAEISIQELELIDKFRRCDTATQKAVQNLLNAVIK